MPKIWNISIKIHQKSRRRIIKYCMIIVHWLCPGALFQLYLNNSKVRVLRSYYSTSGKGCHHDTLLHTWYCNSCSNYRFWLIFFLIDRSRSQAALIQVSSTLLNSDSRTRMKCENIFSVL